MKFFPKQLFVGICNEGKEDQFFEAWEDPDGLSAGGEVAVYEFKERGTVTREYKKAHKNP